MSQQESQQEREECQIRDFDIKMAAKSCFIFYNVIISLYNNNNNKSERIASFEIDVKMAAKAVLYFIILFYYFSW